jgi:hypothetical protein
MAIDSVRRLVEPWSPTLGMLPDEPLWRESIRSVHLPLGVCTTSSAFDSSGRTIASERERELVEPGSSDN